MRLEPYKEKPLEPSYETSNMLDELELDDDQRSDEEDSPNQSISKQHVEE